VRQRGKHGHDNPAFIDDMNISSSKGGKKGGRSKSEDRTLDGAVVPSQQDGITGNDGKVIAKRNRRSRRLQKKNSLDVQFRRRFSMLRDGNAAANNIYGSEIGGLNSIMNGTDLDATNGINSGNGRDSRTSSMMPTIGPRISSGNLSTKILDKRFNKMLFNMHGIPVKPNVSSQQQKKQNNQDIMPPVEMPPPPQASAEQVQEQMPNPPKSKGKRRKANIVEHHV
jgi:hypothetical protein